MNLAQYIPIDPQPIYQYFNAKNDWQKSRIDITIDDYRKVLVKYLLDKYKFHQADLYQIAHDDFVKECGQLSIYGSGKKENFASVMKDITKLYNIYKPGDSYNKKVSFVTLNFNLKQIIRAKSSEDILIYLYGDIDITDPNIVDLTPIDINSLKAFIKSNESYHTQNDKIKEYHDEADGILMVAELTNGILPQIISESEYGRRYYKGQMNLQNTSKVVRNAALGDNYEYDLNTAVYAIKLNYASDITDKKYTYTSEYIEGGGKYKENIRKRLTKHCFDIDESSKFFDSRLKVIKQAITAIGFGATSSRPGFYDKKGDWQDTSLNDIFKYTYKGVDGKTHKAEYTKTINGVKHKSLDLFLQDSWMSQFINEQKEMTNLITDYMINEGVITKTDHPFLVDGRNAINRARTIAYFFQKTERVIMDTSAKFVEDNGAKILLRVHDAMYVNKKINIKELHVLLQEQFVSNNLNWLGSKIISFEETFNQGYNYNDDDESDIDEAFSRLTGVNHVKPIVKIARNIKQSQTEGFYDSQTDYGQQEYNPEHDDYVEAMTHQERREHYRIIGYNPNTLPDFSTRTNIDLGKSFTLK
jgi:hypothetical protein